MNTLIKIIAISTILFVTSRLQAQDFQGEATYKSKTKVDIKLDSTQVASGMADQIQEMLNKQFEKTYILDFNKTESVYKEEEALAAPNPQGMNLVMVMAGGSDILYKNIIEKRFVNQNESFSKLFLIKDELEDIEWTLDSETKNIGDYTCFKATTTREVENIENGFRSLDDKDSNGIDSPPNIRTITITAWYTPQIPVSTGPGNFHGLPGLILEVNDGSETVICSKIVLNPKDAADILEPDKGKEVTQEAFDEIMEKKMKEMEERYRSNDRGRDGEHIEIRIGG